MICPVCRNDMIIVEHQNIELDYCTNCQGVWFDAGELELLLESSGLENPQPFINEMLGTAEAASTEKKHKCPICRRRMKKVFVDEPNHVLIDVCHDRHGLWFDGGEVEHLLKSLAGKYTGKAGPPQDVMEFIGKVFKARA